MNSRKYGGLGPLGAVETWGKNISDYNTPLAQSVPDKKVIRPDRLAVADNYPAHALYLLGKEVDTSQSALKHVTFISLGSI